MASIVADRRARGFGLGASWILGAIWLFALGVGFFAEMDAAKADLRLCNRTQSRVGVAIGYKDAEGWATEGWWNIAPNACETLLRGNLASRYYYLYAVDYDQGGEWSGKAFMCTREKEFTVRGLEDCLARGYDRTGFFEIDTADQRNWTVQLTDPNPPPNAATPRPPAVVTQPQTPPALTPR